MLWQNVLLEHGIWIVFTNSRIHNVIHNIFITKKLTMSILGICSSRVARGVGTREPLKKLNSVALVRERTMNHKTMMRSKWIMISKIQQRKGELTVLNSVPIQGEEENAVLQLVVALRYKSEGRGFDCRWCNWKMFICIILWAALWLWGRLSL
jgi:hypothetical protein